MVCCIYRGYAGAHFPGERQTYLFFSLFPLLYSIRPLLVCSFLFSPLSRCCIPSVRYRCAVVTNIQTHRNARERTGKRRETQFPCKWTSYLFSKRHETKEPTAKFMQQKKKKNKTCISVVIFKCCLRRFEIANELYFLIKVEIFEEYLAHDIREINYLH